MRLSALAAGLVLAVSLTGAVRAAPVLMISIDGLRPADVLDAPARGVTAPTLRRLVSEGAWARGVKGVLPTLTYPSHTTLITGVAPARHGIANNLTFDPFFKNQTGWYWYAEDIRVPTLWDAAHAAGLKVANVHWPVSVGASAIDLNLPQDWRAGTEDDRKLNRALATRGLTERLEREAGLPYAQGIDESVEGDERRELFAERLMTEDRPGFATVYFTGLDHIQHLNGPDTPEAHAALARIDAAVGKLIAAARRTQPDLVVVIVSDHGFAKVDHDVNLFAAFAQAGLIRFDPVKREITGWDAEPWFAGGSAGVVLARPDDAALRARVEALLDRLAADKTLGIDGWIGGREIAAEGGAPDAQYVISFKIGYEMAKDPMAPLVGPPAYKGMHGYLPAAPEMRSTLIVAGPGLAAHGDLGEVDMRDIAPTVARLLGASLPGAEGRPLF
jgi:predicted AlkP superfamily pyrophosphatase or phosphodiesterase